MLNSKNDQVKKIRQSLPYGSFSHIKRRLERKGKPFTAQYISRCLNPVKSDFNQTILDEAILLIREVKKKESDLQRRILRFNTEVL